MGDQWMSAARKRTFIIALLVLTIVLGFALRTAWNAGEAQLDDGDYVLSGNDPYYHKHAVDHIVEEWESIQYDPMLNYPSGSVNPNPPLYQWTTAAGAQMLQPFAGDIETAAWWSTLYSTAIWGALTAIPAFLIGRMFAGEWGGLLASFLIITSPEHMNRSNLGFADHDALVLFLVTWGLYFLIRAIQATGTERPQTTGARLLTHYPEWFKANRVAAGSAIAAGGFLGAMSLVWKGFPYAFGIVLAYAGIQFLINHWRGDDNAHPFYVLGTTMGVALLMGLPYYASFGLLHFWNPAFYIFGALAVMGGLFVATQRYPSVLVVPGLLLVGAAFFAVMLVVAPEIGKALLGRFIYFNQNVLYQTIAEARPADVSSLAFTVGPIPFFVYIAGIPWLLYRVWQELRPTELFLLTWVSVDLFMGISAVRFLSLIVPSMAILAAIATVWLVRSMGLPNLIEGYRLAGGGWRGIRRATNVMHIVAILFVGLLLIVPNAYLAIDAATPTNMESSKATQARAQALEDVAETGRELGLGQETIQQLQAFVNQTRSLDEFESQVKELQLQRGFSQTTVERIVGSVEDEYGTIGLYSKRLGAFGTNFLPDGWRESLLHLRSMDQDQVPAERPAFLAWWDYGHWSISVGEHPAVADNFQNGYQAAGNFIVAQNESHSIQIMAARMQKARTLEDTGFENALTRDEHIDIMVDVGVSQENATRYVDAFQGNEFPYVQFDGVDTEREAIERSAEWLTRLEEATGKHIRYVAMDNRMLPVDDPQTQRIESSSIYYAPVTLAKKDPDRFLETRTVDMQTGQELSQEQLRQIQIGQDQATQVGQLLVYKDAFFNSTYYRAFMGLPVVERTQFVPGSQQPQRIPQPLGLAEYATFYDGDESMVDAQGQITGLVLTREKAPGFGMRHFRLIHINDAVRMLEYTPGATVEGTVTLAGTDRPLANARVTVFDDAGDEIRATAPAYYADRNRTAEDLDVPHDSTVTDDEGRYSLVAPFSLDRGIRLEVVQEATAGAPPMIANATIEITRAQANARETFELDIEVEPSVLEGVAWVDWNADGQIDDREPRLDNVTLSIQNQTVTTSEDGTYRFDGLTPGRHTVQVDRDSYQLMSAGGPGGQEGQVTVELTAGETTTEDLAFEHDPVRVQGTTVDDTGSPVQGITARLTPADVNTSAQPASGATGVNGTFDMDAQPGTYEVGGNGTVGNRTFEVVSYEILNGTGVERNAEGQLVIAADAQGVELRLTLEAASDGS